MKTYQIILLFILLFIIIGSLVYFIRLKIISGAYTHENVLGYSNISIQIAIFLLAIFGYCYTVLPLYSKAVLEEEVAKSQIELKNYTEKLKNTQTLISRSQNIIEEKQKIIYDKENSLTHLNKIILLQEKEIQESHIKLKSYTKKIEYNKSLLNESNLKYVAISKQIGTLHQVAKDKIISSFKDELLSCSFVLFNLSNNYDNPNKHQIQLIIEGINKTTNCLNETSVKSNYINLLSEEDKKILEEKVKNISEEFQRLSTSFIKSEENKYNLLILELETKKQNLPNKWSDQHNKYSKLTEYFITYDNDLSSKVLHIQMNLIENLSF